MHPNYILTVILLVLSVSFAQTINLNGTVKNENGNPISGSHVILKNHLSISTRTDADGKFTLTGTKSGDVQADSLVVISKGHKNSMDKISDFVKSGIEIKLSPSNQWIPNEPLEYRNGMVKIKAKGHNFEMGQPSDTIRGLEGPEKYPTTDVEQPVHTVNFTYDFWMDTVEVRQLEYDSIMKLDLKSKYIRPTWNSSNGLGNNYAAYSLDWGNGAIFCNARSKAEGLPDTAYKYSEMIMDPFGMITLNNVTVDLHAQAYRLPTEAEWEYATRGGTTTDYYWQKDFKPYPETSSDSAEAGQYAVFSYNSGSLPKDRKVGDSYYGVNEVARKKPNKYGLYDMLGNVSEWCNDWYDYYTWGSVTDPEGPILSDVTGFTRVIRGGNWGNIISYIRVTERSFESPDYQFLFKGFRCVSSGISTRIKNVKRTRHSDSPVIKTTPGSIHFTNVAGSEIRIYSLSGKTVFASRPQGIKCVIKTNMFPSGSYIVKIISNTIINQTITILD